MIFFTTFLNVKASPEALHTKLLILLFLHICMKEDEGHWKKKVGTTFFSKFFKK